MTENEQHETTVRRSEQIGKLAEALAKAQGEITVAHADKNNPFFNSKYADLGDVWDACRKPLTDNGLSVVQMPTKLDDSPALATMLMHKSGEWIESTAVLNPDKNTSQAMGSAITYMRRYMLSAMTGVYQGDDDDGNAASGKENGRKTFEPKNANGGEPAKTPPKQPSAKSQMVNALQTWIGRKPTKNECYDVLAAVGVPLTQQDGFDNEAKFLEAKAFCVKNKDNDFEEAVVAAVEARKENE